MDEGLPEEDRLFDEAVDLLIRLQNDPGNPVAVEIARRWRMRGPAHENAWAEAVEIYGMTGKILNGQARASRRATLPSRRTFMIGGFAAAALAGSYTIPGMVLQASADYITSTAEIRSIALPDGSFATLGPDSAIALRLTKDARRIELLKGMAFFEVASDPGRPFSVEVATIIVTALGTAFEVSDDAGFVTVSVDHGLVAVQLPTGPEQSEPRLTAGDWITFDEGNRSIVRGTRDTTQVAAWRDGLIVAEKERISAVVARIARWHHGRIVMANPALGDQRISGVFDLRDPLLALEAVVHPYGGKVRQMSSYLTVISPL